MRLLFLLVLLAGCPASKPADIDAGACAKVGQTCEVSPGKLGTCVQNDTCPTGTTCFACQSQH